MKKLIFLPIFLYQTFGLYAQQSEHAFLDAYAEKGEQEFFYRNSRVSSGSYIYVAGASINDDGDYDMLLTKYSGTTEIWSVVWDGGVEGDDYAADVIIDGTGNIIICGTSEVSATNYNAVVVKYNSSGALQWVSSFAGGANLHDGFVSLERDNSNNIYACGATQSATEFSNYLVTKYNSSGTQQWASTYDYNDLNDAAVKLVITSTYILVSGGTQVDATDWQMTSVKYHPTTGAQGSVLHTGGDDEGIDEVKDVWTDGTYTYIVGGVDNMLTGLDWKVMKLNSDLEVVWSATYNGSASDDDMVENVKVDGSGNVYVTGWATVTGEGKNYVTRKYNSSGTVQWTSTFNESSENADDQALSLEFDGGGNVIVTGSSYKDGNKDFLTVKYNYTDGAEVWKSRFNSDYNDDDIPSNIAIDQPGNIYVIGTVGKGDGTTTYQLCQYKVQTVYMPVPEDGFSTNASYIHNRKQLRNVNGTGNTSIKFYNNQFNASTYLNDNEMYFSLHSVADSSDADTIHTVKMQYTKGNSGLKVYPLKETNLIRNYYLGHMGSKAELTKDYHCIVKAGAYSNTDVIYSHSKVGFRNWIVARTGAPQSDFELTFSGHDSLEIDVNGDLIVFTSLGNITMYKAIAYSMNNTTGELTELNWQPDFVITNGDKVSFTNFDTWSGTLVLEHGEKSQQSSPPPVINNLEWSTFFGGNLSEMNWDVKNDEEGNVWFCGQTTGYIFDPDLGINVGDYELMNDAYIVHFDEECKAIWFTFYGGGNEDIAYGLDIDNVGNVYCVGYTQSGDVFDYEPIGINYEFGGGSDGFYLKLDGEYGFVLVDSYIGGEDIDAATGVSFRPEGGGLPAVIYVCGHFKSDEEFPLLSSQLPNAYNQEHAGTTSNSDGFLMRLDAESNLEWSTSFGGDADDFIYSVASVAGNPVVVGITKTNEYSSDACVSPEDGGFPTCSVEEAWHQQEFSGFNSDYFVARFDRNDALRYSTYFGTAPLLVGPANQPEIDAYTKVYIPEGKYDFYVSGVVEGAASSEFPFEVWPLNYDNPYYQEANSDFNFGFLAKFFVDAGITSLDGCTAIQFEGEVSSLNLAMDIDKGVVIAGTGTIGQLQNSNDYCDIPEDGDFPLCDPNEELYMETNLTSSGQRCFIMQFDDEMAVGWSTQFGAAPTNYAQCVSSDGEFIFMGGYSQNNYTLLEFDPQSSQDYFLDIISGLDQNATITRFKLPLYVGLNEYNLDENSFHLEIYPNPSSGVININLPKQFESGDFLQLFDMQGKLIKSLSPYVSLLTIELAIHELMSGAYLIRYSSQKLSTVSIFIKE